MGSDQFVPGGGWIRRRLAVLAAATVVAGLSLPTTAASAAAAPDRGSGAVRQYVARADEGHLAGLVTELSAHGIAVERTLGIIDGVVVRVSDPTAAAIAGFDSVAAVTPDGTLATASSGYDPASDPGSVHNVAALIGAPDAWGLGHTGQGVDVALIDTGVAPVGPLANAGTVLNGPDLSFDGQFDNTRYLDANGHGTFMAGLIAGRATSTDPGAYQGIAPDARILNVKVGDALGRADVSQVIAGIDWVVQHAHDDGLNVRVLNLSFGTDSTQSYLVDPLAHAAEVAWRKGIVVVAAAGNQGTTQLAMPAADPFVLAVGALDARGTVRGDDDELASFSARGNRDRPLDVAVPGVRIQGLRVPGSYVDTVLGHSGGIGTEYLRGSGTSQAAAIASGAAAVLLSARPTLTPDQVKRLLAKGGYLRGTRGTGTGRTLDLGKALTAREPGWRQRAPQGSGTGSLELARGSYHLRQGGSTLTGEQDIFGDPVDTAALAAAREQGTSWAGGTWNGAIWAGASWAGASWAGASWAGASWAGASWAGASWAGASWSGASWAGAGWATEDWS